MADVEILDLPPVAVDPTQWLEIQDAAGGAGSSGRVEVGDVSALFAGITQLTGDVTAGPGFGSQVATIAADAVTTAKILDANVSTAKIADDAVTYAKIQNVAAARMLGRENSGAGDVQEFALALGLYLDGLVFRVLEQWHTVYVSGRYYSMAMRTAVGPTTVSHAADTVHYTPMQVFRPITLDAVALRTGGTNAVAGNANFGIYASTGGGPGALQTTFATAVAIPGTATTNIVVASGVGNLTLNPGLYWFAAQFDATINMTGLASESLYGAMQGTTAASSSFVATSQIVGATQAAAYAGGLPALAGATASSSSLTAATMRVA